MRAERRRALRRRRWLLGAAVAAWLAAALTGTVVLAAYSGGAGAPARAPARWPAGAAIPRADGRFTLVLFAHPKCPCTGASFTELARLMERVGGRVDAHVLFLRPEGTGADWESGPLWARAKRIPGVAVHADRNGDEKARFGAATSGQVLVYDAAGALAFGGGITLGRGHEGDNPGAERIAALVQGAAPERGDAPVFGCPLNDSRPQEATP